MARFKDKRTNRYKHPLDNKSILGNIRVIYFPKINQSAIYNSSHLIAGGIDPPIYNLKNIQHYIFHWFNSRNILLDFEEITSLFSKHIYSVKMGHENCIFLSNNMCESWIDCKYRNVSNYLENFPRCKLDQIEKIT